MRYISGKWEFEVAPGKDRLAGAWVNGMLRLYRREVDDVIFMKGSAASNGFALDDSVRGWFQPRSLRILIFYSEENDLASLAEELAHYFQYQRQGLLGKTERQIGSKRIDANEREMKEIMLSNGFRIRR